MELKDKVYSYHFDETTTSQLNKQYDGYVTFYSTHDKKVVTAYIGTLFVGRCPAVKIKELWYEFLFKVGLDSF